MTPSRLNKYCGEENILELFPGFNGKEGGTPFSPDA
jgi:hypothetical protein